MVKRSGHHQCSVSADRQRRPLLSQTPASDVPQKRMKSAKENVSLLTRSLHRLFEPL